MVTISGGFYISCQAVEHVIPPPPVVKFNSHSLVCNLEYIIYMVHHTPQPRIAEHVNQILHNKYRLVPYLSYKPEAVKVFAETQPCYFHGGPGYNACETNGT